jgi:hypothetical protein
MCCQLLSTASVPTLLLNSLTGPIKSCAVMLSSIATKQSNGAAQSVRPYTPVSAAHSCFYLASLSNIWHNAWNTAASKSVSTLMLKVKVNKKNIYTSKPCQKKEAHDAAASPLFLVRETDSPPPPFMHCSCPLPWQHRHVQRILVQLLLGRHKNESSLYSHIASISCTREQAPRRATGNLALFKGCSHSLLQLLIQ